MRPTKNHLEPAAQPWVREVEKSITNLEGITTEISESDRNQGVTLGAVTKAIAEIREQQVVLNATQTLLQEQQSVLTTTQTSLFDLATRVSEQVTGDAFDSDVNSNAGAMGTQHTVVGPAWANRALVVASATKNTNPSNGWDGTIELVTMNRSVTYGDVGNYHNVLMIGIDYASFVPQSNPLVVNLTDSRTVYMRPIGTYMGDGTRSANYNLTFSYSITWI